MTISPETGISGSGITDGSGITVLQGISQGLDVDGYPLNDDGTLAALFGFGHIATDAPDYWEATYTYTGSATGGQSFALPTAANAFTRQAILVPPGKILACEFECIGISAAAFANVGLGVFLSIGGTPTGSVWTAYLNDSDGSTPEWDGTGMSAQTRVTATAGFRIGIEIDGDGTVTYRSSDGSVVSSTTFVASASNRFTFYMIIFDSGTPAAGQTANVTLVPHAGDMQVYYSAGAVDVFGATCPAIATNQLIDQDENVLVDDIGNLLVWEI